MYFSVKSCVLKNSFHSLLKQISNYKYCYLLNLERLTFSNRLVFKVIDTIECFQFERKLYNFRNETLLIN